MLQRLKCPCSFGASWVMEYISLFNPLLGTHHTHASLIISKRFVWRCMCFIAAFPQSRREDRLFKGAIAALLIFSKTTLQACKLGFYPLPTSIFINVKRFEIVIKEKDITLYSGTKRNSPENGSNIVRTRNGMSVEQLVAVLFLSGILAHIGGIYIVYSMLPPVPGLSGADALAYAMFRGIPPILFVQWLCNEAQAVGNVFAYNDKGCNKESRFPWNVESHYCSGGKMTWRVLLSRMQINTFEQAFVTACSTVVLSQCSLPPWEAARLSVAWAYVFSISRFFFVLGYASKIDACRLFGLIAGGFWANMGVAVYAMLTGNGLLDPSPRAALLCYIIAPLSAAASLAPAVKMFKESREETTDAYNPTERAKTA